MLVLTRKPNESIVILTPDGSEIEVSILDARNGRSRIGITADDSVTVVRKEIYVRDGLTESQPR